MKRRGFMTLVAGGVVAAIVGAVKPAEIATGNAGVHCFQVTTRNGTEFRQFVSADDYRRILLHHNARRGPMRPFPLNNG